MTIAQLAFGMGFGILCVAFLAYALTNDRRTLGIALTLTGIYLFHATCATRLLPPPAEIATLTGSILSGLCLATGLIQIIESCLKSKSS